MLTERWSVGRPGCVVSDTPQRLGEHAGDVEYYGGYCVAESIGTAEKAHVLAASLDLLAVLRNLLVDCGEGGRAYDILPARSVKAAEAAVAKADGKA